MLAYLLRRLAYGFFVVLGVLGLLYVLFFAYAEPEDVARQALGEKAPPEVVAQWISNHGYDRPCGGVGAKPRRGSGCIAQ